MASERKVAALLASATKRLAISSGSRSQKQYIPSAAHPSSAHHHRCSTLFEILGRPRLCPAVEHTQAGSIPIRVQLQVELEGPYHHDEASPNIRSFILPIPGHRCLYGAYHIIDHDDQRRSTGTRSGSVRGGVRLSSTRSLGS
jgi:hypothetical protein